VVAAVILFLAYRRMSQTQPMNSDGASQALQGWDLLHGNVLLSGWTVSDVSFYTNEVLLFAIVEAVHGLNADAVHIVAAILYTLLVFAVALVARGTTTGRAALARMAVAVAIMLVPASGMGSWVLLGSPDHTGTGVPLLITWLVLDRGLARREGPPRWLPYAVGALLVWGQLADPLVLFIGALPLALVGGWRLWRAKLRRPRQWRGTDALLVLAALGSMLVAHAIVFVIGLAGGFQLHAVPVRLVEPDRIGANIQNTIETMSLNFGAYFPDRHGGLAVAMGALRLLGLLAVIAATAVVVFTFLRGGSPRVRSSRAIPFPRRASPSGASPPGSSPRGDSSSGGPSSSGRESSVYGRDARPGSVVDAVLAIGIVVNLGAFMVSTLPWDLTSARQVTAILTLGAALAGRVFGPQLAAVRWLPTLVAVMILGYGGEFVARTTERPVAPANAELASWLVARNLSYGLGGFWTSNDITVISGGNVWIAPVTGEDRVYGYRWLSHVDWYDPAAHDARFMIVDRLYPPYGTEQGAKESFGAPTQRHEVGRYTVLVYDHNLLVGLPAACLPGTAPSMAECP
jgi:hypothetical protein